MKVKAAERQLINRESLSYLSDVILCYGVWMTPEFLRAGDKETFMTLFARQIDSIDC